MKNSRFLICGKGASGKTTLMRALINALRETQRILVCESDTEIYPDSKTMMVQKMITREQLGKSVNLKDLIRDGLTMSLDGYCIGEITGEEAWDFIQAGYTDHRVFATLHCNSAEEVPYRLMMLSNVSKLGLSDQMAIKMICEALDYIVYMKGFKVEKIVQLRSLCPQESKAQFEVIYERGCALS